MPTTKRLPLRKSSRREEPLFPQRVAKGKLYDGHVCTENLCPKNILTRVFIFTGKNTRLSSFKLTNFKQANQNVLSSESVFTKFKHAKLNFHYHHLAQQLP